VSGAPARDAAAARDRVEALRAAGAALKERPIAEIVEVLDRACARWRDPADPDRAAAEAALADHCRVPPRAVAPILEAAFGAWRGDAMDAWIAGELGAVEALDGPVPLAGARRMARGPDLVLALCAHGVPTTPIADGLAALLVKAPAWIKPASGADDLAARFAGTLGSLDAGLGAALHVRGWQHGGEEESAALASADVVLATGRAETVTEVREAARAARRRIAGTARMGRVIVHGPRLSAALVTREALRDRDRVIGTLADDAAFAGQMGCLSPVVAWIEADPAEVAELAGPVLAACVERWPAPSRSEAGAGERARTAEWLALVAVERAAGRVGSAAGGFEDGWSVVARTRPAPPDPPPVPRVLTLEPVRDGSEAAELCARRRGIVATVGVAAPAARAAALGAAFARAGVERVAPLGAMQRPPLAWRRDGRATLADLVTWFDQEP
jgi:hypothetical protein